MPRRRLVIADDHPVVVIGLRALLAERFEVVATVTDGHALLDLVRREAPDLLLLDFSMPGTSGLERIRELSRLPSAPGIVVLTMHDSPFLAAEAIRSGASAFLLKTSPLETLVRALTTVGEGKPHRGEADPDVPAAAGGREPAPPGEVRRRLTERQATVVAMLASGRSPKRIATELGLSRRTVEAHKYQAMRILGVCNTAGLVRVAIRYGLVRPDDAQGLFSVPS